MSVKSDLCYFSQCEVRFNEPMKSHTTIGVGGKADFFAVANSLVSVKRIVEIAKEHGVNYKIIGNGSNLLFPDGGYRGIIVSTYGLCDIFYTENGVRAMSGAKLNSLILSCRKKGFSGIESLYGIPATVGGGIIMNASAFNVKISDCIKSVTTIKDGKLSVYDNSDCNFSYRKSRFKNSEEYVVSADFVFEKCQAELIDKKIKEVCFLRKSRQPKGKSFGSVFKNPKGKSAGELIDLAGLKGYRIGGAKISEKHGNFIINEKGAKFFDVVSLIEKAKKEIKEKFGYDLETEVEIIKE